MVHFSIQLKIGQNQLRDSSVFAKLDKSGYNSDSIKQFIEDAKKLALTLRFYNDHVGKHYPKVRV